MESVTQSDWMEYYCKSGELLFYYNKVTAEHGWSDIALKMEQQSTDDHYLVWGTQIDDYGCRNGCTSIFRELRRVFGFEAALRQKSKTN